MDKTTKIAPKRIAFIDYKPAELRDNKSWYIEYYAKNPLLVTANNSDYLFGEDFKPSKKQLNPKKISDTWTKYRNKYKFDSKFQFYSLKDTGIMDLLNSGIPSIKVRDQARHYDIKQTEAYTTRNLTADETIKSASFSF